MRVNCITIITPCRNAEAFIGATMESVLNQHAVTSGRVRLDYIVRDGESTDRTLAIVNNFNCPSLRVISEPDAGVYDGLAKGLQLAEGDIVAYLNAGDLYSPDAFDVVQSLFEQTNTRWVTGQDILLNEHGMQTARYLPYRYRRRLLDCGFYGKILAHVQQESTFWSRDLHAQIDFDRLRQFKLAGDFYLWRQFSCVADLHIVDAHLGGFRIHHGQLSENRAGYLREMRTLSRSVGPLDWLLGIHDGLLYYLASTRLKKWLNPKGLFVCDQQSRQWR